MASARPRRSSAAHDSSATAAAMAGDVNMAVRLEGGTKLPPSSASTREFWIWIQSEARVSLGAFSFDCDSMTEFGYGDDYNSSEQLKMRRCDG
jgi:hypothetical protein